VALWHFTQADGLHVFEKGVADKTIALVAKELEVPPEQITPSATFAELGADSLTVVETTMELETAFDVSFPEDEDQTVETVGDAIRLVEQCLARKKR
jgi:acyl carrier protein